MAERLIINVSTGATTTETLTSDASNTNQENLEHKNEN